MDYTLESISSDRMYRHAQGWLEEAEGRAPGSPASTLSSRGNGNGSSPRRSSVSDEVESLSRCWKLQPVILSFFLPIIGFGWI